MNLIQSGGSSNDSGFISIVACFLNSRWFYYKVPDNVGKDPVLCLASGMMALRAREASLG